MLDNKNTIINHIKNVYINVFNNIIEITNFISLSLIKNKARKTPTHPRTKNDD